MTPRIVGAMLAGAGTVVAVVLAMGGTVSSDQQDIVIRIPKKSLSKLATTMIQSVGLEKKAD